MTQPAGYAAEIGRRGQRDLRSIDAAAVKRLRQRILALEDDPRPPGCRMLVGRPGEWRIRVGEYRVIYLIDDAARLVIVRRVVARGSAYKP